MRVLYVEDDDNNAYMLHHRLQRHGVEVVHVTDAASGLSELESWRPDALLLDLHLPDGDGRTLLRRIRAMDDLATLPVIVVSAHVMADERAATLAAGADAFLPKPLDFRRLLDTLQAIVPARTSGEG